jgi:peptidoglycan/LPS O-acetylase OafA/YrhL
MNKEQAAAGGHVLSYRPDIDGLRALAVSFVIIYHSGWGLLPGGFIGVDIFFVISGFLITSIILKDLQKDRFSFRHFYKRRIARILPLFYTVGLVSLAVGYLVFTPGDLINLADSLRYAVGFISNIYFYKSSDYFEPASELLPLLHTWSLGIEEQFYVFWPLILILGAKYLKRSILFGLLLGLAIGLAVFSHWQALHHPNEAYFLLPARAFELLIGAMLAFYLTHSANTDVPARYSHAIATGGFMLVIGSVLLVDDTAAFPGLNAFWPCLGTAMIIYAGSHAQTPAIRFLQYRPLVFVGLISYSLYLWHWPVFSFARYLTPDFSTSYALVAILVTLLVSYFSWRFIEQPLRRTGDRTFSWYFVVYFVVPVIVFVSISKNIHRNGGYPARLSPAVTELTAIIDSTYEPPTLSDPNRNRPLPDYADQAWLGDINNPDAPLSSLLWGDSHALHFQAFMHETGERFGFSSGMIATLSCQPLLETYRLRHGIVRDKCVASNEKAKTAIASPDIKHVFIAARWRLYAETTRNPGEAANPTFLGDDISIEESVENTQRVFQKGMHATIRFIVDNGKIPVIFNQVPEFFVDAANCQIKRIQYPALARGDCAISTADLSQRFRFQQTVFAELKKAFPELRFVNYADLLCDDNTCDSEFQGTPLYKDHNHLNGRGGEILAKQYIENIALDWLQSD